MDSKYSKSKYELPLAIEIMVKCSQAGPSNYSVNIFNAVILGIGNLFQNIAVPIYKCIC